MKKGKEGKEKSKRRKAAWLSTGFWNVFSAPFLFPLTLYLLPFSR